MNENQTTQKLCRRIESALLSYAATEAESLTGTMRDAAVDLLPTIREAVQVADWAGNMAGRVAPDNEPGASAKFCGTFFRP